MSLKFADELLGDVPEDVYLKVLRAFFGADLDSDHPSNELLESLLEAPRFFKHAVAVAFQAGQESALPSEQWRLSNGPVQWGRSDSRADAERQRAKAMDHFSEVWLERRLYGATAWVRVPEAGDTDEH